MKKTGLIRLISLIVLITMLLTACAGRQVAPAVTPDPDDPFGELDALIKNMSRFYGMTVREYMDINGYTADDFSDEAMRFLKKKFRIDGVDYSMVYIFHSDCTAEEFMQLPREEYSNHRIIAGFSLYSDAYAGDTLFEDAYAKLERLTYYIENMAAEWPHEWDHGSGSENYDLENRLAKIRKNMLSDEPYGGTFTYLLYTDSPPPLYPKYPKEEFYKHGYYYGVISGLRQEDYHAPKDEGWQTYFIYEWATPENRQGYPDPRE